LIPAIEAISKEVEGMDRIITDFLSFARPTEVILTSVDLNELIRRCMNAFEENTEKIRLFFNSEKRIVIKGDDVLLRQSITNLMQNAFEAMADKGKLTVKVSLDDYVNILVSDTGHGVPKNIKDKIFLPFYTTKERGTGLGLSIVHKIVVSHGGTIQVKSSEDGTTFLIKLPKESVVTSE
jgi:signal transduction histidine kinase